MTANELFAWMEVMNPSPYTSEQKTLWLNDLEASLWTEVFLQPAGLWRPRKGSEGDRPLLLPESRRMLYAMYLWAMMDFARGEHGSYANSMALYNDHLAQLQCWYAETYAPAMTQAVWTEWAVYAPEDEEEPRCVMTLPGGCAVLGAECRVEEAGDLQNITLGTEGEPGEYMPAGTVPTDRKGLSRFFRFYEPYDRAVYAGGEGTGKVRFRLLLQPEARKGSHNAGQIPGGTGGQPTAGAVVAGEKGDPGADGKSAYEYALEGGYTGTEAEFIAKLASENAGIHIGPEAPTDDSVLWVDTDEEAEEESAEAVPADWNAAEGEPGHVLNRTHYKETVKSEWLPETVCEITEDMEGSFLLGEKSITAGATYKVTWNGVEYICVAEYVVGIGANAFGNMSYFDENLKGYAEPFAVAVADGQALLITFEALPLTATVSIEEIAEVYHPMDRRYLPAMSYIITDVANNAVNESYDNFADILWNGGNVWVEAANDTTVVRCKVITFTYNGNGFVLMCFSGASNLEAFTASNGTWTPHTE